MESFALILIIFNILIVPNALGQFYSAPEQIKLSYGVDPTIMVVTWTTLSKTNESYAHYGTKWFSERVNGTETKFVNPGSEKRVIYIHRAWMTNLKPGDVYMYRVGCKYGWSSVYHFTAQRNDPHFKPRFALYGDLGNQNARSLPRLQVESEKGMYDVILHIGDIAYDLYYNNGRRGDAFMNQIQPIAAIVPYLTCPGNHEEYGNFSNYKARFTMPGDEEGNNLFYSIDIGPVHLISISTEHMFFWKYGPFRYLYQYAWLEKDLQKANLPENRALRPWIITMGHRPMYCSNNDKDDCTEFESLIRTGLPYVHKLGLENLFYKYGVDLELWAHEHSYERLWPVFNRTVYNGSYEFPYTNPTAPVHIITGSAGMLGQGPTPFVKNLPYWSAFQSMDYGYSRMTVHNRSHLYFEQVSDDKHGKVVDHFWLIRNQHGRYPLHVDI